MNTETPLGMKYAKSMTWGLAACTIFSDVLYLVYLNHHHMVRYWSGINSVLLGTFMLTWSVVIAERGNRWIRVAFWVIGALNLVAGFLFFF